LATGFAPSVPEIAMAQPVNCQPNSVKGQNLYAGKWRQNKQTQAKTCQKSLIKCSNITYFARDRAFRIDPRTLPVCVLIVKENGSFGLTNPKISGIWVFCPNFFGIFGTLLHILLCYSGMSPDSFRKIRKICISFKKK
jgi:hypothetical protein